MQPNFDMMDDMGSYADPRPAKPQAPLVPVGQDFVRVYFQRRQAGWKPKYASLFAASMEACNIAYPR